MINNKLTKIFDSQKPLLISVLICVVLVVALLYFGLATVNYNGDGLGYSNQVETASKTKLWSFSARLLYCPTGRLLSNIVSWIGINLRAVYIFQAFNIFMGFLGVGVFLLTAYRLTRSLKFATIAALGLAFSYNFWFWNLNVTSYPGNVFFLICCLFMLVTLMDTSNQKKYFLYSAIIGFFHAMACFYWLTALLLAPSIALGIIIISRNFNFKKRSMAGAIYSITFISFLFIPLVIAAIYSYDVSNFSEFKAWLTYAAHNIPPKLSVSNFLKGIFGFSSSIFYMSELGPFIKNTIFGVSFVLKGTTYLIIEIITFCVLWFIIAYSFFYYIRNLKAFHEREIRFFITTFLWAAPPIFFGLIWLGSDTERWLAVTPIFWLFLLLVVWHNHQSKTKRKKYMGHLFHIFVVILFCYNLLIAIMPNHNPDNNHYMKTAEALNEHMTDKDYIILWGYDHTFTGADLTYFFRKECTHLAMFGDLHKENTETKLTEKLNEVFERGGRVFINGRLFLEKDLPESRYSDDEHVVPLAKLKEILNKWQRREAFTYKQDKYWELK